MAREARESPPSGRAGLGALLIGGILAGLFMPKMVSVGRKAVHRVGGTTYRDQKTGGPPPSVDPAQARAA